jgi:predicted metal-dependent peptidase
VNKAEIALTKMLMSTDPAIVADACAIRCLRLVETKQVSTAATDGIVLLVNPDYIETLTLDQICGLLIHEVCHVRFRHTERFADGGWLDHDRANKSMDREINPLVVRAGYKLPPDGCWPNQLGLNDGLSWEEYYQHEASSNQKDKPQQDEPESSQSDDKQQAGSQDEQQGESSPEGQPGSVSDGVHSPGSLAKEFAPEVLGQDNPDELAEEVAQAIEDTVEQGKIKSPETFRHQAGEGSGSQSLSGELIVASDCRWQDVVIELVASRASGESVADWSRPSRRSIAQGVYRPARRKVSGFRLALVLDVSGSCICYFSHWQSMARELVEAIPEIREIDIYYHDTAVTGRDEWNRSSGEEVTIAAQGGGGTDFRSVLSEVESTDVDGVILFTDSEGRWPSRYSLDCVTVQPPGSYEQSPIGATVRIASFS